MNRKLSVTEKRLGRSEYYYNFSPAMQWAEDSELGILDWDGSKKDAKRLMLVAVRARWCSCDDWKTAWRQLKNFDKMNFCIFCGKKLKKGKA